MLVVNTDVISYQFKTLEKILETTNHKKKKKNNKKKKNYLNAFLNER